MSLESYIYTVLSFGSFDYTALCCLLLFFLPLFSYIKVNYRNNVLELLSALLVSWWIVWLMMYRSKEWWRREKRWHFSRVADSPSGDSSPHTIFRSAKCSDWRKIDSPFDWVMFFLIMVSNPSRQLIKFWLASNLCLLSYYSSFFFFCFENSWYCICSICGYFIVILNEKT